jgi:hypothetical protein
MKKNGPPGRKRFLSMTGPAGVRVQRVHKVQRVQRVVVGACGASFDKTTVVG